MWITKPSCQQFLNFIYSTSNNGCMPTQQSSCGVLILFKFIHSHILYIKCYSLCNGSQLFHGRFGLAKFYYCLPIFFCMETAKARIVYLHDVALTYVIQLMLEAFSYQIESNVDGSGYASIWLATYMWLLLFWHLCFHCTCSASSLTIRAKQQKYRVCEVWYPDQYFTEHFYDDMRTHVIWISHLEYRANIIFTCMQTAVIMR